MSYYVADFETNTLTLQQEKLLLDGVKKAKDFKTHAWGWGITEMGNVSDKDIFIDNSIHKFMSFVFRIPDNPKIYFHNLKFDGHFIISWLLNNGFKNYQDRFHIPPKTFSTLISDMGQFYSITVTLGRKRGRYHKVTFIDSLKKLPFSVDRIAKAFNLDFKKLDVPDEFYRLQRTENHVLSPLEIEYIKGDIRVISQALHIQHTQNMTAMTVGSDALADYKRRIGDGVFKSRFPVLEKDVDDDIKLAYRGGVSMVKESVRNKDVGLGKTYDINSMYPAIMRYKHLPMGKPLFFNGKYQPYEDYNLYIQEIVCEFKLKPEHLPTIQIKNMVGIYSPREYLTESKRPTRMHLTNIDLKLFFEHYDVYNIEWVSGYMFKSRNDMFNEYIDHWTEIKETTVGAMRELAKLHLNSLYGKFGTRTDMQGKVPELNEYGIVKMKLGEPEVIEPIYSAVAVFVTSYGREQLLRTAQMNYDIFCYCDTDSIHVLGTETPKGVELHKTKLGLWDDEGTFTRARFIGAKCYIEDFIISGLKVTCAGMTREQHSQVTFDNFKEGLIVTGKLQPKIVKGGVVLVSTDYQVKVRGFIH